MLLPFSASPHRASGRATGPPVIRLVVNADDGGASTARDRGILRAVRDGIVTSVSVLAGSPGAAALVRELRGVRSAAGVPPGIGLHLNLTEGMPLCRSVPCLLGPGGRFPGRTELWRRGLAGAIDPGEAAREVEAQWRWLETEDAAPDHIDGHDHVHLLPGVAAAVARSVPGDVWIRAPREAAPDPEALALPLDRLLAAPASLTCALSELCRRTEGDFAGKLRSADGLLGLELSGGYSSGDLISTLWTYLGRRPPSSRSEASGRPPDPVLELMAHPGEAAPGSPVADGAASSVLETEALVDPVLRRFLDEMGVRLVPFGAIA